MIPFAIYRYDECHIHNIYAQYVRQQKNVSARNENIYLHIVPSLKSYKSNSAHWYAHKISIHVSYTLQINRDA